MALPYLQKVNHAKIITIGFRFGYSVEVGNSAFKDKLFDLFDAYLLHTGNLWI